MGISSGKTHGLTLNYSVAEYIKFCFLSQLMLHTLCNVM